MFRIPRNLYYRFGGAKPRVDDPVWWTSKQVWGVVTKVESDGSFVFQCGDQDRPSGAQMDGGYPRGRREVDGKDVGGW